MGKINLKGCTLTQMEEFFKQMGEPAYRAKQIFKWIYKGQTQFEKMTDIPKDLIGKLINVKITEPHTWSLLGEIIR